MNVNFYLRGNSIEIWFSFNGQRDRTSTGIHVDAKMWQPKKQRVNPKFLDVAGRINIELEDLEENAKLLYDKFKPSTPKEMKEIFKNPPKETNSEFYLLFDKFIEERKTKINSRTSKILVGGTISHYESCKETVKEFEVKTGYEISLASVSTSDFYSKFRAFCLTDGVIDKRKRLYKKGLDTSTFGAKIRKLKTFLYWCQGNDYDVKNKFWSWEVPNSVFDAEPLTSKELLSLWDLNHEDWRMDIFLALCSTGMRISDYNKVMTNMDKHIVETSEGKAIIFNSQKTNKKCMVPLFDEAYFRPHHLYIKYKGKMPSIDGNLLNDFLEREKLVSRIKITSKTGRKTFCSIKYLEQGIEAQYIMAITGHTTESEFKKYVGASPDFIIKANKEKATYLKKVV